MNYVLPANIENLSVSGADGLYAAGNSLDNLITVGDSQNLQLYGGAGADVLVGGAGNDIFIINAGDGADAIYNWHAGDKVRLTGATSLHTFADVQAAMVQQGADVVVRDGSSAFVIRNTTVSQFSAADFDLGLDMSKLGALTFDDEFNALSLRSASNPNGVWDTSYGYGVTNINSYCLTGNGEKQIYVAPGFTGSGATDLGLNPFSIANGVLDIHAQTIGAATSASLWNYGYTSGLITTHSSFAQTYGYFEMKASLPSNDGGAWPAFWLVPADGSWPPELDVMEQLSGNSSLIYTTEHSIATGSHTQQQMAVYLPSSGGMHTYGVLWTPTDLVWYIDGVEAFHTATPADMNKPMYLLANMAVGGWAGTPDWTSADMQIDYIRAYSIPGVSSVVTTLAPPAPPAPPAPGGGATAPVTSIAPTGLKDAAILNGYVNKAHDTLSQALTGSAAAGATVTVYDGAALIGAATADATGAWSFTLGVLADGQHSLAATASTAGSAVSAASAALAFVVDTLAPVPAVRDVVQGASGQVTITGSAEAGAAISVYDNGKLMGSASAAVGGGWSVTGALSGSGVHTLTQTATDLAGNAGPAAGVTLYAAQPNQTLTGGSGADVLIGRAGDTLTGGAGLDHFVFNGAFGKQMISDFAPATATRPGDQILFDHAFIPDFARLMSVTRQAGADVVISVDRNDVLTLHNVSLTALHAGDFGFF